MKYSEPWIIMENTIYQEQFASTYITGSAKFLLFVTICQFYQLVSHKVTPSQINIETSSNL